MLLNQSCRPSGFQSIQNRVKLSSFSRATWNNSRSKHKLENCQSSCKKCKTCWFIWLCMTDMNDMNQYEQSVPRHLNTNHEKCKRKHKMLSCTACFGSKAETWCRNSWITRYFGASKTDIFTPEVTISVNTAETNSAYDPLHSPKKPKKIEHGRNKKKPWRILMECFILIFRIHHQNVPFLVRKQKAPMQPSPISITGSFANCESLQRWSKFRSQDPSLKNLDSLQKCGSKFIQKICIKYTHKSLDRGVGRTQSYTCRTYKLRLFYAVFCSDTWDFIIKMHVYMSERSRCAK